MLSTAHRQQTQSPPVRLGYVKYLNTLPLVQGLAMCGDVSLHAAVPSHLIDMLVADEIDIGLVSLIDAAKQSEDLALLPVGMIGCDGPTLTVRLFSSVPLYELREVHADTDSHTSTVLLQVLLHEMHGIRTKIVPFDARERVAIRSTDAAIPARPGETSSASSRIAPNSAEIASEWPAAMLLIGDKVVTDSPPAVRYPHQLDLGEAWKKLTGLPFMYAVWMCRRSLTGDARIRLAAALLDRQRRHNATRLDWIVATSAKDRAWPDDLARTYVGSLLRYDVTSEAQSATERFITMAAKLGLCPSRSSGTLPWATIE